MASRHRLRTPTNPSGTKCQRGAPRAQPVGLSATLGDLSRPKCLKKTGTNPLRILQDLRRILLTVQPTPRGQELPKTRTEVTKNGDSKFDPTVDPRRTDQDDRQVELHIIDDKPVKGTLSLLNLCGNSSFEMAELGKIAISMSDCLGRPDYAGFLTVEGRADSPPS
jgi:hypothetical protein